MKGIILAAGRGSRMKRLTDERPKCLTTLAGKPLLEWQLEALEGAGIDEIAIVKGYRAETLDEWPPRTFLNLRWQQTNMVESLVAASSWLLKEACIVSYSDIVYRPDIVRALAASDAAIAISYDRDWFELWSARFTDPLSDAETFRIGEDGRILEIGGKTQDPEEIRGQYMGLLKFTPEGWVQVAGYLDTLPQDERDKLDMTSLLQRLIARDIPVYGVPVSGGWCEADNESDLLVYEGKISGAERWSHDWRPL